MAAKFRQKKQVGILHWLWYFLMGSEAIYHLFKGLYLTAIFTIYQPFMKIWNTPIEQRGVVGSTLFSFEEWTYHFVFGLRGPMVLFGAYLLYRYTCYLSPFKKKGPREQGHPHRGNPRRSGGGGGGGRRSGRNQTSQ